MQLDHCSGEKWMISQLQDTLQTKGIAAVGKRARAARYAATLAVVAIGACGGGQDSTPTAVSVQSVDTEGTTAQIAAVTGSSQLASRFLTQATFGPKPGEPAAVNTEGFDAWITRQTTLPAFSYTSTWDALDSAYRAANASAQAKQLEVNFAFWKAALSANDQLRQRVAFALSEIFVVSLRDNTYDLYPRQRMVASFMDTLSTNAFGNYRTLLEAVALHPAMGVYLSHLRNQKEDAATGRVPDENFAREVMQLFSIGLYELNPDGSVKKASDGTPIETYDSADISGLAKVFTGFSWNCGTGTDDCFWSGAPSSLATVGRTAASMAAYSKFHSVSAKQFLSSSIAAGSADPKADLKVALDALYNHPNVGPFIGKQLIQRLVTSNPSAAYVNRVANAFANNGKGVRGDMAAVVRAVLMDAEARSTTNMDSISFGKVREPVLRLSAFLRAFGATSDSGQYRIGLTDDAGTALGQSAMRSPSVFNFFRPGYVPPNTLAGAAGLAVPEMQITHESSVAGYVNFMIGVLSAGAGETPAGKTRRDVQVDWSAATAVASDANALSSLMNERLLYGQMSSSLKATIVAASNSISIPPGSSRNAAAIAAAKLRRAQIAAALTLAAPEFLTQR